VPKTVNRTYSKYTLEALKLLVASIRLKRIESRLTVAEVAERAGVSRDLVTRIEKGDARCGIGVVFEIATIVGLPLFHHELGRLEVENRNAAEKLALLPKSVRRTNESVNDDF
jgi:transcriptional regulator with XRE-family HTH domain